MIFSPCSTSLSCFRSGLGCWASGSRSSFVSCFFQVKSPPIINYCCEKNSSGKLKSPAWPMEPSLRQRSCRQAGYPVNIPPGAPQESHDENADADNEEGHLRGRSPCRGLSVIHAAIYWVPLSLKKLQRAKQFSMTSTSDRVRASKPRKSTSWVHSRSLNATLRVQVPNYKAIRYLPKTILTSPDMQWKP